MSFTLRLVIAGLCAFVERGDGSLTVLLVDATKETMRHQPMLSVPVKFIEPGKGDRIPKIIGDLGGDTLAAFPLDRERLAFGPVTKVQQDRGVETKHGWFWGPETPWFIIPGHRADFRWVVEADKFMETGKVSAKSLNSPWDYVIATLEIPSGVISSHTIGEWQDDGSYRVWRFGAGTDKEHQQALAETVVVELLISGSKLEILSTGMKDITIPFPPIAPTKPGDVVEISVTNLLAERPEDPILDLAHFAMLCRLAEKGHDCKAPEDVDDPDAHNIAGSGVICPGITYKAP